LQPILGVLGRVTTLLDHKFHKKQITVHIEISPDAEKVEVDSDRMTQVFINLLLNAVQALQPHGTIHISATINNTMLCIEFEDNGTGVTPELEKTLFSPFVTGQKNGTGLGLAISSKIVESFQGTLSHNKVKGGGACFRVLLPV
jgi:signal transduction histidine kinase